MYLNPLTDAVETEAALLSMFLKYQYVYSAPKRLLEFFFSKSLHTDF